MEEGYDLNRVHDKSSRHYDALMVSRHFGCFHCKRSGVPIDIKEWVDNGKTALCPYCNIDAVLPDSLWFKLTPELLEEMHYKWFTIEKSREENVVKKTKEEAIRDRFLDLGNGIGELLAEKRRAYGDNFERSVRFIADLYPKGVPPEAYPQLLPLIRMLDKISRVAQISQDRTGSFKEGLKDAWRDMAGYSVLVLEMLVRLEEAEAAPQSGNHPDDVWVGKAISEEG